VSHKVCINGCGFLYPGLHIAYFSKSTNGIFKFKKSKKILDVDIDVFIQRAKKNLNMLYFWLCKNEKF
jgi:hypothetical protein